ncbi:hypothetical protein DNTS_025796 [Danionella cerebrum]|uniref:Fibronectin type-III domain-containing protein n=1 Tax=Danionella cerebrum TaxID=2873325 RepID=A0A553Q9V4_9TELE|nr:hypothetical protein DNTS_025796 [Danionella translucida]
MDCESWIYFLITLMHIPVFIAGEETELNVTFDVWEGNVTVLWEPPNGTLAPGIYQVKLAPYFPASAEWQIVPGCYNITQTQCDLGNSVYRTEMKVKIELVGENGNLFWSVKRVRNTNMKLFAPEFDLSSVPQEVKVKIHRKPILKELYPYGASYSAILYPRGHESQAITLDDESESGEVTFTSLSSWQEYCVRVKVEITSDGVSNTTSPRCIFPDPDLSRMMYIAIFATAAALSFFMLSVCFFLRRPSKMPAALKSAVKGWNPMNVGLIEVEIVTDKGWLLTNNKVMEKSQVFSEDQDYSEEDKKRRDSTDSGVSIDQQDLVKNRDSGEEDSGCGSLTGAEDRRSLEELPFLDGLVNNVIAKRKEEDSGLGIRNQDVPDCSGDGHISSEVVVLGDGYRSQSPSAQAEIETSIQYEEELKVANPTNRSGDKTCLCSDFETCLWCKTKKSNSFTDDIGINKLSYLKKNDTFNVSRNGDSSTCSYESSLFITCPIRLEEPCKKDTFMLTLGDVELTFT